MNRVTDAPCVCVTDACQFHTCVFSVTVQICERYFVTILSLTISINVLTSNMSSSSSNMVATPTSAYGTLPAQSDTIGWMSFLRQFKAQASADGILACFEGNYKIDAKPRSPLEPDYSVMLQRYNAQVDKRTKDHSFAYLILTKLCDKLSFIIMDHEEK